MKIILALLLSSIINNNVFAKAALQHNVPERIVEAFQAKYPSVKARSWVFKDNIYSVEFIEDKKKCTSTFDTTGQWKSTVTAIASTQKLPLIIKKAFFRGQFSAWYIETIRKYELPETTYYRFLVSNTNLLDGDHHDAFLEKNELTFSASGILISKTLL